MRLALALAAALTLTAADQALAGKISDAEAAFAENRDAQAIVLYDQAIAESANDPVALAGAYFGRGEVDAASGRTDAALVDFTAALALKQDPISRANTLFSRAEAYNRKRNYQAAVDDYGEAIKLQPGMVGAHFSRGRALRQLKRDEEAVAEFDAELKISPNSYRTLSARADALGLPQPPDEYTARRVAHESRPDSPALARQKATALAALPGSR
jgi:tetratricopeptide (TPR) repeat protein